MAYVSTSDTVYRATMARLKKPDMIRNAGDALKGLRLAREYAGLGFNAYHTYQTRGAGTQTALTALGKSDAYREVADKWFDAVEGWVSVQGGSK